MAKSPNLIKMMAWALAQNGKTGWKGASGWVNSRKQCQSFVADAYYYGGQERIRYGTAANARAKCMIRGTSNDLNPPVGAAVYMQGTGAAGHVGLSIGGGYFIDAGAAKVTIRPITKTGGCYKYLGWGWNGNAKPIGAFVSKKKITIKNGVISAVSASTTEIASSMASTGTVLSCTGGGKALSSNVTRWKPIAQLAADKYGVPVELILAVIQCESGGNPRAASSAGAVGLMQLMAGTASSMGCSNRLDPTSNIMAGTRYIATQLKTFKNLDKAIAAYNCGPGNVYRWQKITETRNYVARVKSYLPTNFSLTLETDGSISAGEYSADGSTSTEPTSLPITSVSIKGVLGSSKASKYQALRDAQAAVSGWELLIENDRVYMPAVETGITLTQERKNAPATLTFNVLKDEYLNIQEGNAVSFRINNLESKTTHNMFYGYIFSKARKDNKTITVKCYDQLRYLKNKDTLSYDNKTYSQLLKMIADDYQLKYGTVEDTEYVIAHRIEECSPLEMLSNASDETVIGNGKMFVLYDDFGRLTLKSLNSMLAPVLIDKDSAESFSYTSSIDNNVYNRVKIAYDNSTTGEREVYVAQDADSQSKWGVLVDYEKQEASSGETLSAATLQEKAKLLLEYYNRKQRTLTVTGCFGSPYVRAGTLVLVDLNLGDMEVKNFMLVEKCTHHFDGIHTMDLSLSGIRGEFNA